MTESISMEEKQFFNSPTQIHEINDWWIKTMYERHTHTHKQTRVECSCDNVAVWWEIESSVNAVKTCRCVCVVLTITIITHSLAKLLLLLHCSPFFRIIIIIVNVDFCVWTIVKCFIVAFRCCRYRCLFYLYILCVLFVASVERAGGQERVWWAIAWL